MVHFAWFRRPVRRLMAALAAAATLLLPACDWDGQFKILGYTTRPNYDTRIHTIRVTIFKNVTFWRGLEFDLSRALVREIEAKTPFKVVGEGCDADTELTGTIRTFQKNVINRNQYNEIREAETLLGVEVTWRDLRTGEILSKPRTPNGPPIPPPEALPPGVPVPPPPTVLVQSTGQLIPELGQSLATAQKENVDKLAVQIVSMMEVPW